MYATDLPCDRRFFVIFRFLKIKSVKRSNFYSFLFFFVFSTYSINTYICSFSYFRWTTSTIASRFSYRIKSLLMTNLQQDTNSIRDFVQENMKVGGAIEKGGKVQNEEGRRGGKYGN